MNQDILIKLLNRSLSRQTRIRIVRSLNRLEAKLRVISRPFSTINPIKKVTGQRQIRIALLRMVEGVERILSPFSSMNQARWRVGSLVLVIIMVVGGWLFSPRMEEVRGANVVARSMSVGFVSNRRGGGCIVAIAPKAIASSKLSCSFARRRVHLITFNGLRPETTYRLLGVSGLRPVWKEMPMVTTLSIREERPLLPKPGYGSVINQDSQAVSKALVYVYTMSNLSQYPVAVLANDLGNYSVPLANLLLEGDNFLLQAYGSSKLEARLEMDVRNSEPFPPLVLKNN